MPYETRTHSIRGRDNEALRDHWTNGPLTNLGMMTARFPNFFMVDCTHHPFTSYNTVPGVEFQTEWVTEGASLAWQ